MLAAVETKLELATETSRIDVLVLHINIRYLRLLSSSLRDLLCLTSSSNLQSQLPQSFRRLPHLVQRPRAFLACGGPIFIRNDVKRFGRFCSAC